WISREDQERIVHELTQKIPRDQLAITFEDPTDEEIKEQVLPTKLNNGKWIVPFESLTGMYSLPKYDEIDPTPWMAPFYFAFFGMMVADAGYGALLFLATSLLPRLVTLADNTKKFMQLFQILSVSVIFWGIIYGSAFGATLPFQLLNPTEDFLTIFMLSLIFGGVQLFTGLFLAAKEHIRKKEYLSAVSEGFSWQGLLTGLLVWAGGNFVLHSEVLKITGLFLAGLSAFLILLVPTIQS